MTSVETEPITDFFLRLGSDESLLAEYTHDPRLGLESARLDERSMAVLLSGDLSAVRSAVETEVARDAPRIFTAPRMMIVGEPEPDEDKPEPDEPKPDEPEPDKPEPDESESRARQAIA
jgi:hypothetical protein